MVVSVEAGARGWNFLIRMQVNSTLWTFPKGKCTERFYIENTSRPKIARMDYQLRNEMDWDGFFGSFRSFCVFFVSMWN